MQVHYRKGQASVLLVSIAVLASFLAGAVAFSQVRLIPDMFEERTNDLDTMTRAESRGDNTAYNFVPLAGWYALSQATWHVGTERRDYEGCSDNGNIACVENVEEDLLNTAEYRATNDYFPEYNQDIQYSKCDVEFSEVDIEFAWDDNSAQITPENSENLVTVICGRGPNINATYKSNEAPYTINMANNRYRNLVNIIGGGVIEAERTSESVQDSGDWNNGQDGYWESSVSGSDSCQDQGYDQAKNDAEADARSTARNHAEKMPEAIIKGGIDNVGQPTLVNGPRGAKHGMEEEIGGSQICAFGHCTPEFPANIDWSAFEPSVTVLENDYRIKKVSSSASDCCSGDWEANYCDSDGDGIDEICGWDCTEWGHTGSAEVKWRLNKIRGELKVTDNKYEIPTGSGWNNLRVEAEYERSFPTPDGW